MRKKTNRSILIFILTALILYLAYSQMKVFLSQKEIIFTSVTSKKERPAMTIKGFKLEETKGENLEWILNAAEANMFKNKGEIVFTDVNTEILGDNSKKDGYIIKANEGIYNTKLDKIDFNGEVGVQTSNGYTFSTDDVSYSAKEKKLDTKSNVTMKGTSQKGEGIFVSGRGLTGDADDGIFNIKGDVSTKIGSNLDIQSQNAEVNTQTSIAVFKKKIIARKGKMNIKGDMLEVKYSKSGEFDDIGVFGNVKLNVEKKLALCDNAVINNSTGEVVLTGKPEFHVSGDIMVGDKIVFNTENDEVFVERVKADVSQKGYKK